MLCERARATDEIASLRLALHDTLAQVAVSLRIPPITQLCPGNRSVLLGIAPLLWPLIMCVPFVFKCLDVPYSTRVRTLFKTR